MTSTEIGNIKLMFVHGPLGGKHLFVAPEVFQEIKKNGASLPWTQHGLQVVLRYVLVESDAVWLTPYILLFVGDNMDEVIAEMIKFKSTNA